MTVDPINTVTIFMQSATVGKVCLSQPSEFPSPGYDKVNPKEDTADEQLELVDLDGSYRAPQHNVFLSPGYDKLNPKEDIEDEGLHMVDLGGKGSVSQPVVFPSPGYDKLNPKEDEGLHVAANTNQEDNEGGEVGGYSATFKEQETLYSPLGQPDMKDLPSFAHQIAQGMVCAASSNDMTGLSLLLYICTAAALQSIQEYLSSLGVLHRDLACRNILVDERKLLKISDFGLSRDTPEYVSSLKDKMPLRWMAPETVTDNICTDKSDV